MNANRHYAHQYPTTRTPPAAKKASGYAKLLQAALGTTYAIDTEVQFHPKRRWRFDIVIVGHVAPGDGTTPIGSLAVEIDGGGFVGGRHSRGTGIEKDCEKYAEAMLLGWRILRVTPKHIKNGQARDWIVGLLR